jgi:RDD family.
MKQWGRVATIELAVVGIYFCVASLLIQVAVQILPAFETPNWVIRLIILLLLLGLPVTLVLAWRPISRWVDSRGGPHASQRPGFWLRFVAYFIDAVIVNIPAFISGFMIGVLLEGASGQADKDTLQVFGNLAVVAAGWLYYALMESSPSKQPLASWPWVSSLQICKASEYHLVAQPADTSA